MPYEPKQAYTLPFKVAARNELNTHVNRIAPAFFAALATLPLGTKIKIGTGDRSAKFKKAFDRPDLSCFTAREPEPVYRFPGLYYHVTTEYTSIYLNFSYHRQADDGSHETYKESVYLGQLNQSWELTKIETFQPRKTDYNAVEIQAALDKVAEIEQTLRSAKSEIPSFV